jgi:hypothetical protein
VAALHRNRDHRERTLSSRSHGAALRRVLGQFSGRLDRNRTRWWFQRVPGSSSLTAGRERRRGASREKATHENPQKSCLRLSPKQRRSFVMPADQIARFSTCAVVLLCAAVLLQASPIPTTPVPVSGSARTYYDTYDSFWLVDQFWLSGRAEGISISVMAMFGRSGPPTFTNGYLSACSSPAMNGYASIGDIHGTSGFCLALGAGGGYLRLFQGDFGSQNEVARVDLISWISYQETSIIPRPPGYGREALGILTISSVQPAEPIPEPGTWILIPAGGVALALRRRCAARRR